MYLTKKKTEEFKARPMVEVAHAQIHTYTHTSRARAHTHTQHEHMHTYELTQKTKA